MTKRYELDDDRFELIKDLLPPTDRPGGQWKDHRTILNGMFWVLNSGAQWREMPERYGPWETVYHRFRRWSRDGTFQRMLKRLQLKLSQDGTIDLDTWYVDSTVIRASRSAAGAPRRSKKNRSGLLDESDHQDLGRSRGGFGTKIHLVTDKQRHPSGSRAQSGTGGGLQAC